MMRIRIPGKYWDSQLCVLPYISGLSLVLVGADGSLNRVSWEELIRSVKVRDAWRLLFEKVTQSYGLRSLNKYSFVPGLEDRVSKDLFHLSRTTEGQEIDPKIFTREDNPFPFPYNDAIFGLETYVCNSQGLFCGRFEGPANKVLDAHGMGLDHYGG